MLLSGVTLVAAMALLTGSVAMPEVYHEHHVARALAGNAEALATRQLTARWEPALGSMNQGHSGLQARDPKKHKHKHKHKHEHGYEEREEGGGGGEGGGENKPAPEEECTIPKQMLKLCCPKTPSTGDVGDVVGTVIESPNPNCPKPADAQKPPSPPQPADPKPA